MQVDSTGAIWKFYSFGNTVAGNRGQVSLANNVPVVRDGTTGQITRIYRSNNTNNQSYSFEYYTSGSDSGKNNR